MAGLLALVADALVGALGWAVTAEMADLATARTRHVSNGKKKRKGNKK